MKLAGAKRAVGLEIDTGIARAVEVSGTPDNPRLVNMAGVELAPGAIEEGMVVQPREVGEALIELWTSGEIKHRQVLLGVANQAVLVRYATIPKVPPDKLGNIIRYQAQESLPIPLESVVMDYQIIGEIEEEGRTVFEVLLVAARRDMLEGFLEALSIAKLEPDDIDVSTLALIHTLPEKAMDRTVAIVNIANGLSNILVSDHGRPRMARLVSYKLKDLADGLGCSLEDILSDQVYKAGNAVQVFDRWSESVVAETRSSLTYYQNQASASELEAIILNGRGARLRGIAGKLEAELELPVRIVNPFAAYKNADEKNLGSGIDAVEYAICAGLARRGLEGS